MSAATPAEAARLLRIVALFQEAGAAAWIRNCRVIVPPSAAADPVICRLIRDLSVEVEYPGRDQLPRMPYIVRLLPVSVRQRRKRNNPTIL